MPHSLLIELGLIGPSRFHRDPLFWLALGAGLPVAFAVGLRTPLADRFPGPWILWLAVSTVAVYPILEELAFRGALQGWIRELRFGRRSWAGVTVANLATTGAFTALHFLHHPPFWAASVAVPSLLFGFFRDRDGTVYPALTLHAGYNLLYLLGASSA